MNRGFLKSGIASKIKNIEGKKTSTGGTLNKAIRNIQGVGTHLELPLNDISPCNTPVVDKVVDVGMMPTQSDPKVVVGNASGNTGSFAAKTDNLNSKKMVKLSVLENENGVIGADVAIPLDAKEKVCEFFTNTIYGYFIGKRLAFPIVDMYVKNAWAKYGLEHAIMHKGFFLFKFWTMEGMNKVLENGSWLIRSVPLILNIWTANTRLHKDVIKAVPGHYDYARVLVEVSSDLAFVKSLVVAIPFSDKPGHYLEMLDVEYEWQPPRCDVCKTFDQNGEQCPKRSCEPKHTPNVEDGFVQVTQKKKQHSKAARSRQIEGIRLPKTKSNWIYRAVTKPPPKETSSVTNAKPKYIDNNINVMELKNSFTKLIKEDKVLDVVNGADLVDTSLEERLSSSCGPSNVHGANNGKNDKGGADVASSSKPKLSFGHLDLSNVSDSNEDEVFASQEELNAYMSSIGGGHQLEMEEYDGYDDYADQIRDLPGEIKAFCNFQLLNSGRK
ncbi:zinc knuckle CX2CX4HX4C containing protein [Tanacetum coccineum]